MATKTQTTAPRSSAASRKRGGPAGPVAPVAEPLAVASIDAACERLADLCRNEGVAEADVAQLRPGVGDNPGTGGLAWLRWHGWLNRLHERTLRGAAVAETKAGNTVGRADMRAMHQLAGEPRMVELPPGPDGTPRALWVHNKGIHALMHAGMRDAIVDSLAAKIDRIVESGEAAAHTELLLQAIDRIDYELRVLAWIATSEGSRLPFPRTELEPTLPPHLADLSPLVCAEINRTFALVNWAEHQALDPLIAPSDENGGGRLSWSVFAAAEARAYGVSPSSMLLDFTLDEVITGSRLANEGQRAAHEAAERRAKRGDADVGED